MWSRRKRTKKHSHERVVQSRIKNLLIIVMITFSVCGLRATHIQAFDPESYAADAARLLQVSHEVAALRGEILDRQGNVLAKSENAVQIVADPVNIVFNGKDKNQSRTDEEIKLGLNAPARIAKVLVKYLGGDEAEYIEKITRVGTRYVVLAKSVTNGVWEQIKADLTLGDGSDKYLQPGIFTEPSLRRVYPNGQLAANILGFVNRENIGSAGIEATFNKQLTGVPGKEEYQYSPNGRIPLGKNVYQAPQKGLDVHLTIDSALQYQVEKALKEGFDKVNPEWGIAIVMKVKTGEILAMAQAPTFDPNKYADYDVKNYNLFATTKAYEPGSVEKIFTFATAFDKGVIEPDTVLHVPAYLESGGAKINDYVRHGEDDKPARAILTISSNIGTALIARNMDKGTIIDYLNNFGFGKTTGLGFPGETKGLVPDKNMTDQTRDQIAFGQGIANNALQMTAGIAAIANGGVYNWPRVVASTNTESGNVEPFMTSESRRVISDEAAAKTRDVMETVMNSNTNLHKYLPTYYRAAGKTGTAQTIDPKCKCYGSKVNSSFGGFAPAENPELAVYVVYGETASSSLAPVEAWKKIMDYALPRYGVPASTSKAKFYEYHWK